MTPEQHRIQAAYLIQGITDPAHKHWRRGEQVFAFLIAQCHLAAASGDFVGEARQGGWRYVPEVPGK